MHVASISADFSVYAVAITWAVMIADCKAQRMIAVETRRAAAKK